MKNTIKELKMFLILWSTQSLSQLGSAMTGFALTLWVLRCRRLFWQCAVMRLMW